MSSCARRCRSRAGPGIAPPHPRRVGQAPGYGSRSPRRPRRPRTAPASASPSRAACGAWRKPPPGALPPPSRRSVTPAAAPAQPPFRSRPFVAPFFSRGIIGPQPCRGTVAKAPAEPPRSCTALARQPHEPGALLARIWQKTGGNSAYLTATKITAGQRLEILREESSLRHGTQLRGLWKTFLLIRHPPSR